MTAMMCLVQGALLVACVESSKQCMKLTCVLSAERPPGRCKLVCIRVGELEVYCESR